MNRFGFVCLLVAGLVASALASHDQWHQFKAQHGKVYENPLEEKMRHSIFLRNKRAIERFNEAESGEAGYELGLNHLADWTEEEVKKMLGFKLPKDRQIERNNSAQAAFFLDGILEDSDPLPASVDWRSVPGRVTPVKDQGQCGSCWAFSTTGVLEGQELKISKQKDLIGLSEQNLVDCVDKDLGCAGGLPIDAMDKIKEEGGIVDEDSYPYTATTGKVCKFNKSKVVMTDSGYALLKEGDEDALKKVVAKFGPVSVAIDASPVTFQFYRKGVYKSKFCHSDESSLDHAVLIVGYGTTDKGVDYWLVKNSWDTVWGDEGYIKMARNNNNMCGIATMAAIPTFA